MPHPRTAFRLLTLPILTLALSACGDGTGGSQPLTDPGTGPWALVPADRVAEECGLDPDLLQAADAQFETPWAVVRYGKLCHEYYPDGSDAPDQLFSATKTMGAVVVGIAAYETRNFENTGPKTGPLSDADRVDHWLNAFTFNPDAQVAHVLSMVAHNEDLSYGAKVFSYDAVGNVQINRLNDVVATAIAQDAARLGANVDEFTQRFLFDPLGMTDSTWSPGEVQKPFAFGWESTVRDMARLGLLILNDGVWNGERVLAASWVDKLTHPGFEDANTGYGALSWLSSRSNYVFVATPEKFQGPNDPCSPATIWPSYPHGVSASDNCGYDPPWDCEQLYDVGVWSANGLGGQIIAGHPGLDMVIIAKDLGSNSGLRTIWDPVRPALVAEDPTYAGDEEAFCEAYGNNAYAPDLRE